MDLNLAVRRNDQEILFVWHFDRSHCFGDVTLYDKGRGATGLRDGS